MPGRRIALLLSLVLAACVAAPSHESEHAVLPGTIGAAVEAATGGVRVTALAPGGPAARAGLRRGDTILTCAGHAVSSVRDFNRCVVSAAPGGRLHIDVLRDDRRHAVDVEVMQLRTGWRA